MDFWTPPPPRVGPPVDQVELVQHRLQSPFSQVQVDAGEVEDEETQEWLEEGGEYLDLGTWILIIVNWFRCPKTKTDDDLMLLPQIEIFRTKTSRIEKERSKAGADWQNALLLTATHVVGLTITSAYSLNSSWLGLGTPAPPPSLQ